MMKSRLPWLVLVLCLLTGMLILRFTSYFSHLKQFPDGQQVRVVTKLTSEPSVSFGRQHFSIRPIGYEPLFVTLPLFPSYHFGDTLSFTGKIKKKVLDDRRVLTQLNFPKVEMKSEDTSVLTRLRKQIHQEFYQALPPVSASLLLGIVFGSKEDMPEEFKKALQNEGLTHIIAASGTNVSMLAGVLLFLCSKLLHRRLAIVISMLGIVFYTMLIGFEPSITRATIMALIGFCAALVGRQQWALVSLIITGYVMLVLDPRVLSNLGFQLSFLSTAGILYLKPQFSFYLPEGKRWYAILLQEDFLTTFSAQLITFPLLLMTFGTYNLLAIVSNMLVLWTIPFLMILGGLGALCGLVSPFLGQVWLFLSLPLLMYFQQVVMIGSHFSLSMAIDALPMALIIGYYGILLSLILLKHHEKTHHH